MFYKPFSRFLIPVLVSLFIISCSTDYVPYEGEPVINQQSNKKSYTDVAPALWTFFEAFEEAADEHGIMLDLNKLGITGVIEKISEDGVAGTCQYGQHIHHVTIDRDFWNQFSAMRKEMVVFHELGHCVLGRGHQEKEDASGFCKSIMNSGTSGCSVLYNQTNRAYYLQELFSGA